MKLFQVVPGFRGNCPVSNQALSFFFFYFHGGDTYVCRRVRTKQWPRSVLYTACMGAKEFTFFLVFVSVRKASTVFTWLDHLELGFGGDDNFCCDTP